MDLSSLSETQQQQLQQLHQQFQQHQQQQQQELASQAYDPSQAQPQPHAYNQSTQAYDPSSQPQSHAYNNQSTHAYDHSTQAYDQSTQAYDQSTQAYYPYHQYPQHHYPYYQQDYANAYQPQSQPSQTDVQPPGISVQYEAAAAASSQALATATSGQGQGQGQYQQQNQNQNAYYPQGVAEQQQPNSSSSLATPTSGQGQGQGQYHHHHQQQQYEHHNDYYPQGIAEQQQNSSSSYSVPSGLNPAAAAAVAALSQLNQFAGNMDAAERAMAGLQERRWPAKSGGYGAMPPHMYPQGGFHHEPYPVRGGAGRGGGQYRGGGRRGGGQFRGGRGNFGNRQSRADGSSPHFRGKGRGRGRGRRIPPHEVSSSPYPGATPMDELDSAIAQEEAEQSAVEQGEAPQTAPVPISDTTAGQTPRSTQAAGRAPRSTQAAGRTSSSRRPPQIAWCELCRVDCTSLDILEQHNNGKRHKKNLQRFEELQQARNPVPVIAPTSTPIPAPVSVTSNEPIPASVPESVPSGPSPVPSTTPVVEEKNEQIIMPECESDVPKQPENVQGDEVIKALVPENITTEAATDENKMETEQQKDVLEQPDVAEAEPTEAHARKRRMDGFDARRRGVNKMMMRGGRGSKRMRMTERPTRSVEPPKEVVPIICDLCNVKCDTQAVFDCHLSGKKHISKLKRFQSHQAIYGPVGLQALYPPNPNTQPIIIPQLHHQQPRYMPQTPFYPNSMRAYGPPQGYHVTHVTAGSETQARFNSVAHAPEINTGGSQVTGSMGLEGHQLASSVMQEHQQELAARIKSDNGITESVGKAFDVPLQKSVLQSSGNAVVGSEHVVQSHTTNYAVQAPTYGVSSSENVILPGQSSKAEEPRE